MIYSTVPLNYILLLAPQREDLRWLESLLQNMQYAVETADSADSAVAKVSRALPCLVMLQGNCWSPSFMHQLRTIAAATAITLVMVTDSHAASWFHPEENPDIDGFLVKPLSQDILSSLVQSASVRQACIPQL
jgi:DNA-binding NtrC family response regulator